jgi:hypothetical protein
MESGGGLLIVQLILRIVCMVACSNKAKALNRNSVGWGFLGFVFIFIPVIWIYCLKPITNWEKN